MRAFAANLMRQPYLLLTLTTLMWGGNAIAGRAAVGEVSPMMLTCLRWVIVVTVLVPVLGRRLVKEWPALAPHWPVTFLMGALGFTAFNALFYAAAHHTTAVNLTIIQGSIPILVLIGTTLFFQARISLLQVIGMTTTLAGVMAVSARGDIEVLRMLAFNIGDIWMLVASLLYAGYTLGLRNRPPVPGLVFFTAMAIAAFLTSLPLVAIEALNGALQWPTLKGWAVLLYVGLCPSLLSQVFFIRGVELIGPARAGLFVNLVPVFGALLAVILLGEPFAWYHMAGLVLVLGGIGLAERKA